MYPRHGTVVPSTDDPVEANLEEIRSNAQYTQFRSFAVTSTSSSRRLRGRRAGDHRPPGARGSELALVVDSPGPDPGGSALEGEVIGLITVSDAFVTIAGDAYDPFDEPERDCAFDAK